MRSLHIRRAIQQDVGTLTELIQLSVRTLQAQDYSPEQMEGALGTVFGVDSQLIADESYFVVEDGEILVGCGGWSKRRTLFGSDHGPNRQDTLLDPQHDNAKIRALFVHPDWARKGVSGKILEACENAARIAGFQGFDSQVP